MCGIAGILSKRGECRSVVGAMTRTLAHRGPDDEDVWADEEAGVGLGHRRLAIVDLSQAGRQPMQSASGRYVLTFNGEIYNHPELRQALEERGAVPEGGWRGHSDAEVFLRGIEVWGLEETLWRSVGMFAFGLWDRQERVLSLVRDRFGEKPLYYGWVGGDLLFASELKALRSHPRFDNAIDRNALSVFAARTYIPAPLSIYERIFKLPPASILAIGADAAAAPLNEPPEVKRYWSYRDVLQNGLEDPIGDDEEALDELERSLAAAIQGQSMADVPVGAFLSGGIDSSTVCAIYQKYSSVPIRTFSIGFEEAGFNEAEDAKRVAAHLGTVHHERYLTVGEAQDVIPQLPAMYDEPFADSSQIPTYLVSRFAREQVTVALTGDGGDELFAGYNRHFAAPRLWEQLQRLPHPLRTVTGIPLSRLPSQFWSSIAALVPGQYPPHLGGKVQKALRVAASARTFDDVYRSFLDEWAHEQSPAIGADSRRTEFDLDVGASAPDALRMMYCDAVSYLPDDILAKVDRASMAVSLETRVPFLDHRVAEVAARIPLSMKVHGGRGKQIVRGLLHSMVPSDLVDRPKAGFAVPVGEWIKGPLRPWAEELLDPAALRGNGFLNPAIVRRRWEDHLSGRRESTPAIWAVLMFQAWLREQRVPRAAAA